MGNETEFKPQDTNTFLGNLDNTSEAYAKLEKMIGEYQDKSVSCSHTLRDVMQAAECEQKKQNPDYQSLEFVLDRAGMTV